MSAVRHLREVPAADADPFAEALRLYALPLDTLMTDLSQEGRRYRCGLMALRDRAVSARHKASRQADFLIAGIESLASIYCMSRAADNELLALYDNLQTAFQAAINIHVYGPADPL